MKRQIAIFLVLALLLSYAPTFSIKAYAEGMDETLLEEKIDSVLENVKELYQ